VISIDTNILFPALNIAHSQHQVASEFIASLSGRRDVAISEFILLELYGLIRNPTVMPKPLKAAAAVEVCQSFRRHPNWQILGFPLDSREFHDQFWPKLAVESFARRRAYDWRIGLTLLKQGVTGFATANEKDFRGFGFKRVWNPLKEV
jgi:predicted nucleic acid-binding protein